LTSQKDSKNPMELHVSAHLIDSFKHEFIILETEKQSIVVLLDGVFGCFRVPFWSGGLTCALDSRAAVSPMTISRARCTGCINYDGNEAAEEGSRRAHFRDKLPVHIRSGTELRPDIVVPRSASDDN
jgi:hypothetical protein